jgi:hypothetical protein
MDWRLALSWRMLLHEHLQLVSRDERHTPRPLGGEGFAVILVNQWCTCSAKYHMVSRAQSLRLRIILRINGKVRNLEGLVSPTQQQLSGKLGEEAVCRTLACPQCSKRRLSPLPTNFDCVDVICRFCGFMAQVKSISSRKGIWPNTIPGGSWPRQHEQIIAGIFHSLFVVALEPGTRRLVSIDYVPSHILRAVPDAYVPRKPTKPLGRSTPFLGFRYDSRRIPAIGILRVFTSGQPTHDAGDY